MSGRHGNGNVGLLDTYDQERRPVADRTVAQALARLQAWFTDTSRKLPPPEPIEDDYAVIFGYRYPAGAFVADEDGGSSGDIFENPRAPSGRPGSRAAHLRLERGGERLSTVDLFSGEWVLFAGPNGDVWRGVASRIPAAGAFGLQCYRVGRDRDLQDVANRWSTAYAVNADGAILIRPDGFIAWRGRDAGSETQAELGPVLERLRFCDS